MKPGRLNTGPYHLSCIESGEEPTSLEDILQDAKIFAIKLFDDNFADIIHFLTTRSVPMEYTLQQKK